MTPSSLRSFAVSLAVAMGISGCHSAAAPAAAPLPVAAPPAPLAASLDSIFADPRFARAHWGVSVRSLSTGRSVYERNPEKLFVPASTLKLVTGMAAIETLGPEHRFRTTVGGTGAISDGVLRGDLVVAGSGDPSISARFGGDARSVFRAWADSLRARGVTRITGRVVGNDDVFDDAPLGRGWAWDDVEDYYSAEVSGLQFNEGVVTVAVAPGEAAGRPGRITLEPATGYIPVTNRVTTVAPGAASRITLARASAGPGILVSGTVAADTAAVRDEIAVRDNTLYFVTTLREVLRDAGIRVDGPATDADENAATPHAGGAANPLFVHASPPLREILPAFWKPSQNQIGEILLRTLGRERRGAGTGAAGAAVVDSLLRVWSIQPGMLAMADGSGLSRYNLLAPELLVALLTRMEASPHRELYLAALPVAGTDGTLARRLQGTPLQGKLRAKTGTLSGVRGLSGFLDTAAGERLVFAALVNHHTLSARDADRVVDAALLRLYAQGSGAAGP